MLSVPHSVRPVRKKSWPRAKWELNSHQGTQLAELVYNVHTYWWAKFPWLKVYVTEIQSYLCVDIEKWAYMFCNKQCLWAWQRACSNHVHVLSCAYQQVSLRKEKKTPLQRSHLNMHTFALKTLKTRKILMSTRRFRLPSLHILHMQCEFCAIRAVGRNLQFLHVWARLREKSIVHCDGQAQERAQEN